MSNSLDNFVRDAMEELHDVESSGDSTHSVDESSARSSLSTLPGHHVDGLIARGGMGKVYRARQTSLEREVAVKVMTRLADSPEMASRFRREALVLSRLEHPNIVPVHDIGTDDEGRLFYTMKLVKGRTLQAILKDLRKQETETMKQHTLASLLTIFRKICDALAFAHSQGVLHRDLKPENIMVGEFGEVLVMDWGLAKIQDKEMRRLGEGETSDSDISLSPSLPVSQSGVTLQGSVMGTPQYMSPEQARGEVDELDARSDIFSLGGILYAILTLCAPVEGKTLDEVLEKVRSGSITPPTAYGVAAMAKGEVLAAAKIKPLPHIEGGRVPFALSAVAMKAMQLEKARRYQSVAELSADIEAYQAGFATKAERAGLTKQLVLLVRRHKGVFSTVAAACLTLALLAAWFVINLHAKEQRAVAGEQTAVREKEAARHSAAASSISLAEASLREANGMAMQAALNEVPDDLRDSTWSYLLAESDSSIAHIRSAAGAITAVAANPAAPGVFAFVDVAGKVTIMNVRTRERLTEFNLSVGNWRGVSPFQIAFSPDGQHLAIATGLGESSKVTIYRATDGSQEKEWPALPAVHLEYGLGDALLLQGFGGLQVFNPETAQLRWERMAAGNVGVTGHFLPGGREVAQFTQDELLQVVDAGDGHVIRSLGGRNAGYDWIMAVRPDGAALISWTESRMTQCVSLEDGRVLFALPDKTFKPQLGFTPDGTMLFTIALRDEGVQEIKVWNAQTGEFIRSFMGGQGPIAQADLHPLSHELFVAGADSRVWDSTGPTPGWTVGLPSVSGLAFWGEDLMFVKAKLYELIPGGMNRLWQPDDSTNVIGTSADGMIAAGSQPGGSRDVRLFRRNGRQVESLGSFKAGVTPSRLRPSHHGSWVAVLARLTEVGLEIFDRQGSKVDLDTGDMKRSSDLVWLDDRHAIGLLTHHAARGDLGAQESVVLWDASTGRVLKTATHPTAMDVLAAAPDGRRFAEAGADKIVRIRDGQTLEVRTQFRAHNAPITALAWHPTLPLLATGSDDLSIKVWNLETGRLLVRFDDLLNRPDSLAFSPSGRYLASRTNQDYIGRVWTFDDWLAPEPHLATSPLSPANAKTNAAPRPPKAITEWQNVLALLTRKYLASGTGWHVNTGVLLSPKKDYAGLALPGDFSDTGYQLHLRLRKLEGKATLNVALPVGKQMVDFRLDGYGSGPGVQTGLTLVGGNALRERAETLNGPQVTDTQTHDLDLSVRLRDGKAAIRVTLDDKVMADWSGAPADLSQGKIWSATGQGRLAIGSRGPHWEVTEVKVRRLMAGE